MGDWEFPNAIAVHARLTAALKNQHPNRLALRDPGDVYPALQYAAPEGCVQSGEVIGPHEFSGKDPFCRRCGHLGGDG